MVVEYGCRFPKGLFIEDVAFTFITTFFSHKIVMVKEAFYYYRQRPDSIMAQFLKNKNTFDIFKVYKYCDSFLERIKSEYPKKAEVYARIFDDFKISNAYSWYENTNDDYKKLFFQEMRNLFLSIDIKKNPFLSSNNKKIYKTVKKMLHCITKIKLFGLLICLIVDKKSHSSKYYLFGVIPFLKIKKKYLLY
jgi:hypothetical protein